MKTIKVKEVVTYAGHSLRANGSVNLTVKAMYSELTNSIQMMQMLNNDVDLKARVANGKPMRLGYFRIQEIKVDSDGESTIKFNGISDNIEMDHLNELPLNDADTKQFTILAVAEVDLEDGEDGEEVNGGE